MLERAQPKLSRRLSRADTQEMNKRAKEIGERIRVAMENRKIDRGVLAQAMGMGGSGTGQYAKLAKLAIALGVTPNDLLGFGTGTDRELSIGAIEGALIALGHSPLEAAETAEVAAQVLDRPPAAGNPRERGQEVAGFLVGQFVDSKRR
jgi:hypothetical protein